MIPSTVNFLILSFLLLSFQERTLEAVVQPEDNRRGSCVHQQPQRVVTLRWPAAAPQGHEQYPQSWTEE